MIFKFENFTTNVHISRTLPRINVKNALFVCDENTKQYADKLRDGNAVCELKSGEENKNWDSVAKILSAAKDARLSRDGAFIGVGGGVICDLTAFAASIYMRGCRLRLVATTLLAMADAALGGKTGIDLFGIKNIAGTFYPAETVYMPLETLNTLPEKEWKSGLGELIKTMVLMGVEDRGAGSGDREVIEKAVKFKGKLVEKDFRETKGKRALLNLGHTFGHALEAAAGFGAITHGEAVAWGIAKACDLGVSRNITPVKRANQIKTALINAGFDITSPHPLESSEAYKSAFLSDKKKKNKNFTFIVPNKKSAQIINLESI